MSKISIVQGGVTSAKGFRACGVEAGVKYRNRKDVALVVADVPCSAAALFTTNRVAAAPVLYDREVIKSGRAQAVFANSGCANACTGPQGLVDAESTARDVAAALGLDPKSVLVASTGVIGRPLPMDRIAKGVRLAASALGRTKDHAHAAACAIMTTDTRPKEACARVTIAGKTVTIGGMSKGSGMIHPNMATMLGFLTTDASLPPPLLKRALRGAVAKTFNHLVVDGDESTNDSVFLLASGLAGLHIKKPGADFALFCEALTEVCLSLARQMAQDGEGATKFVTVTVKGARDEKDAERAARAVAKSPLVKTSWFGRDPNWGRVLAAVGYSGADMDGERTDIFYDRVWAFRAGRVADEAQLAKLKTVLAKPAFEVVVDLHLGSASSSIYTCDFSTEYVHINGDYTT